MGAIKEYDAKVDGKNRVTLRGAQYEYYNVKEYDNGCYLLEPRKLAIPEEISKRTLCDMDKAVSNLQIGKTSAPIDLSDF